MEDRGWRPSLLHLRFSILDPRFLVPNISVAHRRQQDTVPNPRWAAYEVRTGRGGSIRRAADRIDVVLFHAAEGVLLEADVAVAEEDVFAHGFMIAAVGLFHVASWGIGRGQRHVILRAQFAGVEVGSEGEIGFQVIGQAITKIGGGLVGIGVGEAVAQVVGKLGEIGAGLGGVAAAPEVIAHGLAAGADEDLGGDVLGSNEEEKRGCHVVGADKPFQSAKRVGCAGTGLGERGRGVGQGCADLVKRAGIMPAVAAFIEEDRLADLPEIAGTFDPIGGLAGAVQDGKQDGDQQSNDADDDQKLDQRKGAAQRAHPLIGKPAEHGWRTPDAVEVVPARIGGGQLERREKSRSRSWCVVAGGDQVRTFLAFNSPF